ncbi:MAG: hypothetical protein WAU15_12420 [Nitrosomonas sp.]
MAKTTQQGFVYLWALYTVALAGLVMAGAAHVWQAKSQREKEAELLFIGEQFRLAIKSYQSTGTKQYPKTLEELLEDKRTPNVTRHLRKMYIDPITNTPEWGIVNEEPPKANPGVAVSNASSTNSNTAGNKTTTASSTGGTGGTTGLGGAAGGLGDGTSSGAFATNTSQGTSNSLSTSGTAASTTNSGNSTTSNSSTGTGSAGTGSSTTGKTIGSSLGTSLEKRITGVYSLSERKPIKKSQFPEHFRKFSEAKTYQDWQFVYKPGDSKSSGTQAPTGSKPNTGGMGAGASSSPFGGSQGGSGSPKPASPFGQSSSSNTEPGSSGAASSPFGR